MENSTEIYDLLKLIELDFGEKIPLFGRYVFVKADEIRNIIGKIRNAFPEHIKAHKIEIYKAGYGKVFDCLDDMENILDRAYKLFSLSFVNTSDFYNLIDDIYAALPSMFQFASKYINS